MKTKKIILNTDKAVEKSTFFLKMRNVVSDIRTLN